MPSTAANRLWQAWMAAVVFVFPIPGTIALRNLLLLVGLVILLATARMAGRPRLSPTLRPIAFGLAAITGWLAFHSLALAPAPMLALDNLRGDWLLPLLTGALAAFAAARTGARNAVLAAVSALLAHMLWVLVWQYRLWLDLDTWAAWPTGFVPFAERDFQSSLAGFLIALLVAERVASVSAGLSAALLPHRFAWTALAISLVADIVLQTRNGTLTSIALLFCATIWLSRRRPRFISVILIIAALAGASLALDARWSGLKESLATGWTSPSLYWLTNDPAQRPRTSSGAPLEESAYSRAAWTRQAVIAIREQPLGLGYGRDGFGRAIAEKYGQKGMVSSHSGWLDFALGAGLPGLVLLLLTAGIALHAGWRQFRRLDDAAGLMLCFLVGGYLLRCLVDGHLSGWRLGLFAFLGGLLVAAMKSPQQRT